ncbi:carbon-nitrogen hydrolase family protein [Leucobacter weissii]|nr:carbon-nitrogen hydrolase family protein [Leucobacter weissii]
MHPEAPSLRIAVWQAASTPRDVAANLASLDDAARRAAADGAELLVAPEMYLTGYNIGADIARLAAERPLERAREIARRRGIALVAGGPEPLGEATSAIANAAWLVDDRGEVLARHRKIQLFGDLDRVHFVPGDAPVTLARFRGFTIALLICFDVEYPETVRAAALDGADLIAVPTAQMAPFSFVNEHLIRTRAWESSVYVAYANQVGTDGDFDYVGRSVIADPLGAHLAEAGPDGAELLTARIDRARIAEARRQNTYLSEVRRELFAPRATP